MKRDPLYNYLEQPNRPIAGQDQDDLVQLLQEVESLPDQGPDDAYWQFFDARLQHRLASAIQPRKPWYLRYHLPLALCLSAAALVLVLVLPSREQPSLANLSDDQLSLMAALFEAYGYESTQLEVSQQDDALLNIYEDDAFDIFAHPDELPDAEVIEELWNSEG